MKYWNAILCIGVAAVMCACAARKSVIVPEPHVMSAVDTSRVSVFAPEALYVITREYELHVPPTQTLADYMDERLMQLYPNEAYRGVSSKLFGLQSMFDFTFQQSLSTNKELVGNQPVDTLHKFVSLADEEAFLNLLPAEKARFEWLNTLAQDVSLTALSQLVLDSAICDSLGILPGTSWLDDENLLAGVLLPQGAYLFYRVLQSKSRAELWAQRHYGDRSKDGKKGDAFKHLLVNVLLRRYVTEAATTLIMDAFWETRGANAPCDKYMDLHNNYTGRHVHYHDFVRDTPNDWETWARRVLLFVEDDDNAAFCPWDKTMPTISVRESEKTVDAAKYIYWNKDAE
ncbi:MAG: DUF6973 domain-containing protein [Paludibacteraceae bacterium]